MQPFPYIAEIFVIGGIASAAVIAADLSTCRQPMRIMHSVWILTGLWASFFGLWAYFAFGRAKHCTLDEKSGHAESPEPGGISGARNATARGTMTDHSGMMSGAMPGGGTDMPGMEMPGTASGTPDTPSRPRDLSASGMQAVRMTMPGMAKGSSPAQSRSEEIRPAESMPLGSMPPGTMPTQSNPAGSQPEESMHAESMPLGSMPPGIMPTQSNPAGSQPEESMPAESMPLGSMPMGSMAARSMPTESAPMGSMAMENMAMQGRPRWQSVVLSTLHCGAGCTLADLLGEWFLYFVPVAIGGSLIAGSWVVDYLLALLFGIGFQYAAIRSMEPALARGEIVRRAAKADFLSLTAWQAGMYGWMAVAIFALNDGMTLPRTSFGFWFMMQIAMACGFLLALPVNVLLIRKGIKKGM